MCEDCGCQEANEKALTEINFKRHRGVLQGHHHEHSHEHAHEHTHNHGHHEESAKKTRTIEVKLNVLAENDRWAKLNREWLQERGVVTLNFISSPGSGKTFLLEKTLSAIKNELRVAVLVGDQETENDARRLRQAEVPTKQINTHSACHLDAQLVSASLKEIVAPGTQVLFIENVGNLVCPAAFDLGEDFKVALLSTTEGEDKPIKYPVLFHGARLIILTKMDLEPHLEWDLQKCIGYIRQVNADAPILPLSAKTGAGMAEWLNFIKKLVQEKSSAR